MTVGWFDKIVGLVNIEMTAEKTLLSIFVEPRSFICSIFGEEEGVHYLSSEQGTAKRYDAQDYEVKIMVLRK